MLKQHGGIESFFGQTGTHVESRKTPPFLVPSGDIFKILASRYSKNALPGPVCFYICFHIVKYIPNYSSLHYEKLFFVDEF